MTDLITNSLTDLYTSRDLITNPHHPEINDLYKRLKMKQLPDDFLPLDQGLIYEKYKIIDDDVDEIINSINYPPFTYTMTYDDRNVNILDISEIVMAFLSLWYKMEIEYLNHINLNQTLTFIPKTKNGNFIYYRGLVNEQLIYDEIKGFRLISDDLLTPYVVQQMYPDDSPSNYKSYKKLFLIQTDDYQKIEYIRNKIKEMKEEGYVTLPNKFISLTKREINIAAEMIKYSMDKDDNYEIIRLEPFVISKTSYSPSVESINSIENNELPIYQFNAPSIWIVHTSRDIEEDPTSKLQLRYLATISYLEIIKKYPILEETIKSIKVLSRSMILAQFPHDKAYHDFNRLLTANIERTVLNSKNNLLYRVFNDYSEAVIFRWKFQNSIKSLIFRHHRRYYVFFEIDNAVNLLDYDLDDVKQEIINQIQSHDINFMLSLVPISETQYIEEKKYQKLILDGYYGTPLLKGMLKPESELSMHVELGTILMNKNEINSNLIQYSFEILVNNVDLYLPLNDALLSKFNEREIKRDNIERKFYDTYDLETAEISLIYPSKDPGYIYPLFDIIVPINKYNDDELYQRVEEKWRTGEFLSTWGKSIYLDHKKLSIAFLKLPKISEIIKR